MKYLKQYGIILFITFIGEILHYFIPLPIPASIYGLVLLFLSLQFHVIKLEQIQETAGFLVAIMPIMFVPAGVGLMTSWNDIRSIVVQIVVITLVSTIAVMAVAGRVTQSVIKHRKKQDMVKENE